MKIKLIAAHIALIASFGMAASAHAQLLGGGGGLTGGVGGMVGGMVGGSGSMGGQLGGQLSGRGSMINDMRAGRAADVSGRGNAAAEGSGRGSAGLAGNILPSRNRVIDGQAAGGMEQSGSVSGGGSGNASGNASGSINADLAGTGRQLTRGAIDGARGQVESTRGFARSSVANARNAAGSVQVQPSVDVGVSGSANGSAAAGNE